MVRARRDDGDETGRALEHRELGEVEPALDRGAHEPGSPEGAVARDRHPAGRVRDDAKGWVAAGRMEERSVGEGQRHGRADVGNRDLDDRVHPLSGLQQAGQAALHGLGAPQGRELPVDDPAVHLLGDGDEPDRAVEGHEREAGVGGGTDGPGGDPRQPGPELDDHAGHALRRELTDPSRRGLGAPAQAHAGREDQLPTEEQVGDVLGLGHVHPADRPVQEVLAGDHQRAAADDLRQGDHLGDADRVVDGVRRSV